MSGLVFEANARAPVSAPERADIACFVGFVRVTGASASPEIQQWLVEHGWSPSALGQGAPVPIERWNDFARLFDWEGTYLGAAVRSFFTQGGRKCYIVRVDNPWDEGASRADRAAALETLLPGTGELFNASPQDRTTWSGAAHVFGLDDVSFMCMPDIAAAVAVDDIPLPPPVEPPPPPEVFVDCTDGTSTSPEELAPPVAAPRCDSAGYERWSRFLARVKALLSRHARDIQLLAAIPLPYPGTRARTWEPGGLTENIPYAFLLSEGHLQRFESAFMQLVYPWARTPGSTLLPEGIESPEGVLAGVLARNALLNGTFRSALNLRLADVQELFPTLGRGTLATPPQVALPQGPPRPLDQRVTVFGPAPGGPRVLSDVTTSTDESWRQGGVNRLFSVLLRAARRAGNDIVFEPSGERTWLALVRRIESILVQLWEVGALRGATARDAFDVRCDRTTMTQDDLDAGRLVATVALDAAAAIERIHVVLTLAEEGAITLEAEGTP